MSVLYTSISVSADIHYVATEDLIHSLATTFNPRGMMLEWKCNGYSLSRHTGVWYELVSRIKPMSNSELWSQAIINSWGL